MIYDRASKVLKKSGKQVSQKQELKLQIRNQMAADREILRLTELLKAAEIMEKEYELRQVELTEQVVKLEEQVKKKR
jgi:hypothetical protein